MLQIPNFSRVTVIQRVRNFTGYQYASRFIPCCVISSVTVWPALFQLQLSYKNSVFLSGKLCRSNTSNSFERALQEDS